MKIVKNKLGTILYLFVSPEREIVGGESFVMGRLDGTVKLVWNDQPVMTLEAAQEVSEALLRAVEIAKTGRKGR